MAQSQLIGGAKKRRSSKKTSKKVRKTSKKISKKVRRSSLKGGSKPSLRRSRKSSKKSKKTSKKTSKKIRRSSKKTSLKGGAKPSLRRSRKSSKKSSKKTSKKTSKKIRKTSKKTSKKVRRTSLKGGAKHSTRKSSKKTSKKTSKKSRRSSKKTSKKVRRSSLKGGMKHSSHRLRHSRKSSTKVLKTSKKRKLIGGEVGETLKPAEILEKAKEKDKFFIPILDYILKHTPVESRIDNIRKLVFMFTCFIIYSTENTIEEMRCMQKIRLENLYNIQNNWRDFNILVKEKTKILNLEQSIIAVLEDQTTKFYIANDNFIRINIVPICKALLTYSEKQEKANEINTALKKAVSFDKPEDMKRAFESFFEFVLNKVLDKVTIEGFNKSDKVKLMEKFTQILKDSNDYIAKNTKKVCAMIKKTPAYETMITPQSKSTPTPPATSAYEPIGVATETTMNSRAPPLPPRPDSTRVVTEAFLQKAPKEMKSYDTVPPALPPRPNFLARQQAIQ